MVRQPPTHAILPTGIRPIKGEGSRGRESRALKKTSKKCETRNFRRRSSAGRCRARSALSDLLRVLELVDLESGFLRWSGEARVPDRLKCGHQRLVSETLPALARVVDGDNDPSIVGRPTDVEELALWKIGACIGVDLR